MKEEEAKAAMVRLEMIEQHLLDAILVIIFVICIGRKREECVWVWFWVWRMEAVLGF